jgi:Mrp family chromosome partitioning ATPase/capsular polysaccharide biosynthesis protein
MLAGWEVELALLKQQYSYTTPTIRDLTRKIEAAQARLNALFQTLKEHGMSIDPVSEWQGLSQEAVLLEVQLRGLEQNEELLKSKIERFKADHPELISKEVEFARLERTARIHEQTYMLLIDKLEGLRLLRQMQDREMQVIERATPPEAPVKPNRRLVLTLGLLLGVMAGVGAAFFLEAMDDSLKAEVDVVKVLGVPVVGVIPVMKIEKRVLKAIAGKSVNEHHDGVFASSGKKKRRRFKKERKRLSQLRGRMITYVDSRSFFTESYRLLRTNLRLDDEQDSRVILVSGAKQGDGKTLTVVNLAIAMARVGVRTLMVDADLRNPKLHHLFGQTRSPGLCEALVSKNGAMPQAEIETNDFQSDDSVGAALTPSNCIRETDVENLYLLPSGATPDSPAELLGSRRMRQLIKALKSEFEVILFDSPPILPVTDATVLASEMADGVLLVVKSGETKREIAQRGRELLDKVNANLLGVVLNAIDYEKYYGSDYSYYYESHSPNDEAA